MDAIPHHVPRPADWSQEREGRLTKLFNEGLSFSLIAADIGVTRSAAIGKARRMKLPKRGEPITRQKMPVNNTPRRRGRRTYTVKPLEPPKPKPVPEPVVIPGHDYTVTINELTDTTCRYPLWRTGTPHNERFYCGRPGASLSGGRPYCRAHARLCWPH